MSKLNSLLISIRHSDISGDYAERNRLVIEAVIAAWTEGLSAGFRIDPKEPEWPVVYIELQAGQVSWHIEQHSEEWDGHNTSEKYERVERFVTGI